MAMVWLDVDEYGKATTFMDKRIATVVAGSLALLGFVLGFFVAHTGAL